MNNTQLQIALLNYFLHAKTVQNAAKREEFKDFTRKDICLMTNALKRCEFLQANDTMKSNGVIYRVTEMGRLYLRLLKGEDHVPAKRKPARVPRDHAGKVQARIG